MAFNKYKTVTAHNCWHTVTVSIGLCSVYVQSNNWKKIRSSFSKKNLVWLFFIHIGFIQMVTLLQTI